MLSILRERKVRPRRFSRLIALPGIAAMLVLTGAAQLAQAQSILVPNNITESDATSGLSTPFSSAARTYLGYLDETQFASLTTPVLLTGIQFRLALGTNSGVTGNWPSQVLTFSQYNIQLAQASAAAATAGEFSDATATFASNQDASTAVTVRSGALTIATSSFPLDGGTGVNSFGPVISFTTPYTYTPGQTLTYLISHSGYGTSTEPQAFFASTDFVSQTVDALVSTAGAGATTPTGFSSPLFVQFQYTTAAAVPEPGTVSLLLAGGAALGAGVFRRRFRK